MRSDKPQRAPGRRYGGRPSVSCSEGMPGEQATHDLRESTELPAAVFRLELVAPTSASFDVVPEHPGHVYLGSSNLCELIVPERTVSRRHAGVLHLGNRLQIDDLDSKNGLVVNGVQVSSAYLRGGELVELGLARIRVSVVGSQAAHLSQAVSFGRLFGAAPRMRRLYPLLEKLAQSPVTTLVEGETGTGKEVLAEALHEQSKRRNGPFVVLDCTAIAPNLVESALFGHERGAFTGAVAAHAGVFERAHGGTLLIDEVGDLDLPLQAKLLRAIERSEVCRVGGSKWFRFDVRILAATRRDLEAEVQAGRFRDDLFYRLAVARVELPPLRDRKEDIEFLARLFWRALEGAPDRLTPAFLDSLRSYSWPGNVRQLQNAIARRVALGEDAEFGEWLHELSPSNTEKKSSISPAAPVAPTAQATPIAQAGDLVATTIAEDLPYATAKARILQDFERRYLRHVLDKHQGNISRAAAASGIARRYFYVLLGKHEGGG